jgi:hypothetical protein
MKGENKHRDYWVSSGVLDLNCVAVQVIDWMNYSESLTLIVNQASPHAQQFIKLRVGRLSEQEMRDMIALYEKYYPTHDKLIFKEKDGMYQTDIISECVVDNYYHFGDITPNKTWQCTTAGMHFGCNSEWCIAHRKKHNIPHKYPTFYVFSYDRKRWGEPDHDWDFS